MPKYQYGLLKFETGEMDPETGATSGWVEEKVYQDSCVIEDPEADATRHYAQGDADPKVTRYGRTVMTVAFSVFDRSADSKVKWLGGTKTTLEGVVTWHKPIVRVPFTRKALRLTFEDGSVAVIPNAECAARNAWNPNDTDVAVIPVVAAVMSTGVAGVSAWQETDV